MIKTIPTEILQEAMLAVQDLRRKYLGEEQITQYASRVCPLCDFTDSLEISNCTYCPWMILDGYICSVGPGDVENYYLTQSISERLRRIDRWETALVEELASRRCL